VSDNCQPYPCSTTGEDGGGLDSRTTVAGFASCTPILLRRALTSRRLPTRGRGVRPRRAAHSQKDRSRREISRRTSFTNCSERVSMRRTSFTNCSERVSIPLKEYHGSFIERAICSDWRGLPLHLAVRYRPETIVEIPGDVLEQAHMEIGCLCCTMRPVSRRCRRR
jgi:hypothetical protein